MLTINKVRDYKDIFNKASLNNKCLENIIEDKLFMPISQIVSSYLESTKTQHLTDLYTVLKIMEGDAEQNKPFDDVCVSLVFRIQMEMINTVIVESFLDLLVKIIIAPDPPGTTLNQKTMKQQGGKKKRKTRKLVRGGMKLTQKDILALLAVFYLVIPHLFTFLPKDLGLSSIVPNNKIQGVNSESILKELNSGKIREMTEKISALYERRRPEQLLINDVENTDNSQDEHILTNLEKLKHELKQSEVERPKITTELLTYLHGHNMIKVKNIFGNPTRDREKLMFDEFEKTFRDNMGKLDTALNNIFSRSHTRNSIYYVHSDMVTCNHVKNDGENFMVCAVNLSITQYEIYMGVLTREAGLSLKKLDYDIEKAVNGEFAVVVAHGIVAFAGTEVVTGTITAAVAAASKNIAESSGPIEALAKIGAAGTLFYAATNANDYVAKQYATFLNRNQERLNVIKEAIDAMNEKEYNELFVAKNPKSQFTEFVEWLPLKTGEKALDIAAYLGQNIVVTLITGVLITLGFTTEEIKKYIAWIFANNLVLIFLIGYLVTVAMDSFGVEQKDVHNFLKNFLKKNVKVITAPEQVSASRSASALAPIRASAPVSASRLSAKTRWSNLRRSVREGKYKK